MSNKRLILLLLFSFLLLLAFVRPVEAQSAARNCAAGLKEFQVVAKVIPNASMTDESTKTVYLAWVRITNTTAGALTVTVQDKQSTPRKLLASKSIGANDFLLIHYDMRPEKFTSGISWQASSTGLEGAMYGCQVP